MEIDALSLFFAMLVLAELIVCSTRRFAWCMIKIFRGEGVVDGEGVAVKGA